MTTTTESSADKASTERLTIWENRWKAKDIAFHRLDVNPALMKYVSKLTEDNLESHILLPLCGKTLDVAWLYQMGYHVTGVEGVEQAILEFFQEHNLEFSVERIDSLDGSLYKSLDGRLKMYCCDFFKFANCTSSLGQFDCVFDRGSLVAIYKEDRPRYVEIMKSLLKSTFRYLLLTVEYDCVDVPREGEFCKVEILEEFLELKVIGNRSITRRDIFFTNKSQV